MNKRTLKLLGIFAVIAAVVCLSISACGLLWLYYTGYPAHALVPRPIIAALLGMFVYTVMAIICLILAEPQPPRGGKRRKITIGSNIGIVPIYATK